MKAEISRLDALAVGKTCYARLYSYSRLKKKEPLIALEGEKRSLNFYLRRPLPRDLKWERLVMLYGPVRVNECMEEGRRRRSG